MAFRANFARKVELRLLALALAICLSQVALATLSGRGPNWHDRYLSLWSWDGGWYADIIENGYRTTSPSDAGAQYNLAFFPAYPVIAGFIGRILNLSSGVALLLTSQISTFAFWFALLLLLRRWQVPATVSAAVVITIFCQPGAYYFVVTYSEALFFACFAYLLLLGPGSARSRMAFAGACAAGYVMSATRIVGAPLAVLPCIWAACELGVSGKAAIPSTRFKIASVYGILAVMIALGTLSFFTYCAVKFGHWNEYMRAGQIGWFGNHPDYHALFSPRNFRMRLPRFDDDYLSSGDVTRLYFPVLAIIVTLVIAADAWLSRRRTLSGFSERLALYVAAVFMLLICASSGVNPSNDHPTGFIRYGLYVTVPIILALGHAYASSPWRRRELPLGTQIAIFLICAVGLAMQLQFCWRYARAIFVA
jgi:hypothetical protein